MTLDFEEMDAMDRLLDVAAGEAPLDPPRWQEAEAAWRQAGEAWDRAAAAQERAGRIIRVVFWCVLVPSAVVSIGATLALVLAIR